MTTVQSANNVSQALLDSVNGSKSKKNGTSVDDVQNRFMTLLVTQMKNQDPLNPMDNAQVTSQMAQLSTVTGIDKLNATVESLISSVQSGQSYQASSMIGHNVLVAGTGGYFGVELPNGADKVSVNIKNSAGAVVRTVELGPQSAGTIPLSWDGYAADGSVAPIGSYKVEVSATVSGKSVEANALSYSKVLSVSNSASGITLNLNNDTSVSTSEVKEIF